MKFEQHCKFKISKYHDHCKVKLKIYVPSFSVNYDLDAEKRVLPNAPLIGYDEDFLTMSLRTFDLVNFNL